LPTYTKYFKHVLPLSTHCSYEPSLEFSDRVILPRSVYFDVRRAGLPFPPLFVLLPERSMHNPVYCFPAEFSAEEDFLYIPIWMFGELGFRVINYTKGVRRAVKCGYGVYLQSLKVKYLDTFGGHKVLKYSLPECKKVVLRVPKYFDTDLLIKALAKFSVIKEGSKMTLSCQNDLVLVHVQKVFPAQACVLIKGDLELEQVFNIPTKAEQPKYSEASQQTESQLALGIYELPEKKEKYPKFLLEIMNSKKPSKKLRPKKLSTKLRLYSMPPEERSRSNLTRLYSNLRNASLTQRNNLNIQGNSPLISPRYLLKLKSSRFEYSSDEETKGLPPLSPVKKQPFSLNINIPNPKYSRKPKLRQGERISRLASALYFSPPTLSP